MKNPCIEVTNAMGYGIEPNMTQCLTQSKTNAPNENDEESMKFLAKIILSEQSRGIKQIMIPSRVEWIGINLLERDDELKRIRNNATKS